jgi:hypothetical protein
MQLTEDIRAKEIRGYHGISCLQTSGNKDLLPEKAKAFERVSTVTIFGSKHEY